MSALVKEVMGRIGLFSLWSLGRPYKVGVRGNSSKKELLGTWETNRAVGYD